MNSYQSLMNDYTNNIDFVEKMYSIKCSVMENGLKKVNMVYYFCSCDPEGNDPICQECKDNCHTGEGHITGEAYEGMQVCQCGVRCHKLELADHDSVNRHVYKPICYFNEISYVSKEYKYFLRNKRKICIFCKIFCSYSIYEGEEDLNLGEEDIEINFSGNNNNNNNNESNDINSNMLDNKAYREKHHSYNSFGQLNEVKELNSKRSESNSIDASKKLHNHHKINENSSIENEFTICECEHSLHADVKNIYRKINVFYDENRECKIGNFGPLRLINLIYGCKNTFNNVFGSFITAIKYLTANIFSPKYEFEKNLNNSNYYWSLIVFANISSWCKNIYFLNPEFIEYFNVGLVSGLLNKRFDDEKTSLIIRSCIISCFTKFTVDSSMNKFPNIKISDFMNMNPMQRILLTDQIKNDEKINKLILEDLTIGRDKKNIIDFLIIAIDEMHSKNFSYIEIYDLMYKVTLLFKKFTKSYLINESQGNKFLFSIEKLVIFLIEKRNKFLKIGVSLNYRTKEYKCFINIIKTLHFLLFYFNDTCFKNTVLNNHTKISEMENYVDSIQEMIQTENSDFEFYKMMKDNGLTFSHLNYNAHIFKTSLLLFDLACNDFKDEKLSIDDRNIVKKIFDQGLKIVQQCTKINNLYLNQMNKLLDFNSGFDMYLNLYTNNLLDHEVDFLKLLKSEEEFVYQEFFNFFTFKSSASNLKFKILASFDKICEFLGIESDELYRENSGNDNNYDFLYKEIKYDSGGETLRIIENKENENNDMLIDNPNSIYKNSITYNNNDNPSQNILLSNVMSNIDKNKYKNISEDKHKLSHSQSSKFRLLFNKTNYIQTIMKILLIEETDSSNKNYIDREIVFGLFKILKYYVLFQPLNAIMCLNSEILYQLKNIPVEYMEHNLDFVLNCLDIISKFKYSISSLDKIIFMCFEYLNKSLDSEYYYFCLNKYLKVLKKICSGLSLENPEETFCICKASIKTISIKETHFEFFKLFLQEVSNQLYIDNSQNLNNKETINDIYLEKIPYYNKCPPGIGFKIYYKYLSLINTLFDDSSYNESHFLINTMSGTEANIILKNYNLDLKLRTQIISLFRRHEIDISYNFYKEQEYKNLFSTNFNESYSNTLIKEDDIKSFLFFNKLLSISKENYISTQEYELLYFELKNFEKIVFNLKTSKKDKKENMNSMNSSDNIADGEENVDNTIYNKYCVLYYFYNSIAIPLKIYLKKLFASVIILHGENFLNAYEFILLFLRIKKLLFEKNILNSSNNNNNNESSKVLISRRNMNTIDQKNNFGVQNQEIFNIIFDIKNLTEQSFQPLNYIKLYEYYNNHIESMFKKENFNEMCELFNRYEINDNNTNNEDGNIDEYDQTRYEEYLNVVEIEYQREIATNKNHKSYLNIQFNNLNESIKKLKYFIDIYKISTDYKFLTFSKSLDNTFGDNHESYGKLFMNTLFFMTTQTLFEEEKHLNSISLRTISCLLINQTEEIQQYVKTLHISDKKLIDLSKLSDMCFKSLSVVILNNFSPSYRSIIRDYSDSCSIIKILKNLCEGREKYFSDFYCQDLKININGSPKISKILFDMMLHVQDKIVLITNWDKLKHDEMDFLNKINQKESDKYDTSFYYPLFSYLSDLLIEIVQGASTVSINNIFSEEEDKQEFDLVRVIDTYPSTTVHSNNLVKKNKKKTTENLNKNDIDVSRTGSNIIGYENKKAEEVIDKKTLSIYLNSIKPILFNDKNSSSTLYSIRFKMAAFIVSFLEENNCNQEIKNLIVSNISSENLLKSIIYTLKKLYYRKNINKEAINKVLVEKKSCETKSTNMSIDMDLFIVYTKDINDDINAKNLIFNVDFQNYFSNEYFNDSSISESPEFDLAIILYKILKIYIIELKDNEDIRLLNEALKSNESLKDDLISFNYYSRKKNYETINKLTSNDTQLVLGITNIENYYLTLFFDQIVKKITIKLENGKNQNIIFTVIRTNNFVSENSKKLFFDDVNRESQFTKLSSMLVSSEYFLEEIKFNNSLKNTSSWLYKISSIIDYNYVKLYLYFIVLLLLLFLYIYMSDFEFDDTQNHIIVKVSVLAFFLIAQIILVLIFWIITKLPLVYSIEVKKMIAYKKIYGLPQTLMFYEKLLTFFKSMVTKDIAILIIFLPLLIVGIIDVKLYGLFSFMLLGTTVLNDTMSKILTAITSVWESLFVIILFDGLLCYLFAVGGVFFFSEQFIIDVSIIKIRVQIDVEPC